MLIAEHERLLTDFEGAHKLWRKEQIAQTQHLDGADDLLKRRILFLHQDARGFPAVVTPIDRT